MHFGVVVETGVGPGHKPLTINCFICCGIFNSSALSCCVFLANETQISM